MNAKGTLQRINLKKVVIGRGHDGMGLIADVYLDKTKIAEFLDDGWGGEPEIRFLSDSIENEVKTLFVQSNVAEYMFQNGWDFMESANKIDFNSQFGYAVDEAANQAERNKDKKKIDRACISGIVFGNDRKYRTLSWKGVKSLSEIINHPQGKMMLQQAYNNAKKELQDGDKIFNAPEQLIALGINL